MLHPIIVIALTVWWVFPALIVGVLAVAYSLPHRVHRHGSVH